MCRRRLWPDDPMRIARHGADASVDPTAPGVIWLHGNRDAVCDGICADHLSFLCMRGYWSRRHISDPCGRISEFFPRLHCDRISGECSTGCAVYLRIWLGNPRGGMGDLPCGNSQCGHGFMVFAIPFPIVCAHGKGF